MIFREELSKVNLVVGKRYSISFTDCCVRGSFIGIYQGMQELEDTYEGEFDAEDREGAIQALRFDTGEITTVGRVTFTELPAE